MASFSAALQFHDAIAGAKVVRHLGKWVDKQDVQFSYKFENFFHPFVSELIEQLNRKSVPGLLDPATQGLVEEFFDAYYEKLTSDVVKVTSFPKQIELELGGSYAGYNWELFFHVPLAIAVHLTNSQRFAEAQRWFHFIFDPTSNDTSLPVPQRYWKFLAFRRASATKQIDEQLTILSKKDDECTPAELALKKDVLDGYRAIQDNPFQPHKVARTRLVAYQYWVVMSYLDCLIKWGDKLFRDDTVESINEATQIYILAANLLGHRPQRIPRRTVRPKTFAELRKQGLDEMGNALVELESKFPLNTGLPQMNTADPETAEPLFGIGRTLYFCIPRNEKMLGYWDTVADRLFKIRHCMNIEGVVRQLPLFDPPIDPAMLVKAAAAGIDISSIVNGLNQPVSPVRSTFLLQKALELCSEVRSLGGALLSAIEKGDAESLALLRQKHEIGIQQMQQEVRFLQWASAQEAVKSLLTSRKSALERFHYYQRLLGLPADPNAPDKLEIDFATMRVLDEKSFAEAFSALVGQYDKPITTQNYPPLNLTTEGRARLHLTASEDDEFVHSKAARDTGISASVANALAAGFAPVPDPTVNLHFWGMGGTVKLKVGTALVAGAKITGDILGITAAWEREQAQLASKSASLERRADDWVLQHNLAAHELMQIGRQILTSIIAEQIASHEYETTRRQIAQSQELDRFLREKFTNLELYTWMQGDLSRRYYDCYCFAFDTARKAQTMMKRELMRPEIDATDFIKFNYWDGGRRGLLAGEALYLDVKRMELAYHENNRREYELTRHISLRQLDPVALIKLKATGSCEVSVPEWVFDLDTPGHYLRRIKTVALTIPCVTGPYTGVNCKLTLLKSSVRTKPDPDDPRFVDYYSATQSIVTSGAQNDSGLFDINLHEERFLPFEGAGAESVWRLELPAEFRQFDYNTVSDVVMHMRYTARDGGAPLRSAAVTQLRELVADTASALGLLFSLRYDFPSEWAKFTSGAEDFAAVIRADYFPYITQGRQITITGIELFGLNGTNSPRQHTFGNQAAWDAATSDLAERDRRAFTLKAAPDPAGPNQVLTRNADAQVFVIVRYSIA